MSVAGDHKATTASMTEMQRQMLEALRAQQQAYLAAVKSWREALAKGVGQPPAWPELKVPELSPEPAEIVEASYAFAAKLLAEQSRFMSELARAMATPVTKAGKSGGGS
jgi:hypothetical protein